MGIDPPEVPTSPTHPRKTTNPYLWVEKFGPSLAASFGVRDVRVLLGLRAGSKGHRYGPVPPGCRRCARLRNSSVSPAAPAVTLRSFVAVRIPYTLEGGGFPGYKKR